MARMRSQLENATGVSGPFGVFVADNPQKVQFAFIPAALRARSDPGEHRAGSPHGTWPGVPYIVLWPSFDTDPIRETSIPHVADSILE